jgi:hypothetical protein
VSRWRTNRACTVVSRLFFQTLKANCWARKSRRNYRCANHDIQAWPAYVYVCTYGGAGRDRLWPNVTFIWYIYIYIVGILNSTCTRKYTVSQWTTLPIYTKYAWASSNPRAFIFSVQNLAVTWVVDGCVVLVHTAYVPFIVHNGRPLVPCHACASIHLPWMNVQCVLGSNELLVIRDTSKYTSLHASSPANATGLYIPLLSGTTPSAPSLFLSSIHRLSLQLPAAGYLLDLSTNQ